MAKYFGPFYSKSRKNLAWALKAAAFAFCFLKAKTAFSFIPKAVNFSMGPQTEQGRLTRSLHSIEVK